MSNFNKWQAEEDRRKRHFEEANRRREEFRRREREDNERYARERRERERERAMQKSHGGASSRAGSFLGGFIRGLFGD
ncbi:MAG: hypothetical protein MJE68_03130 [Proteobacteria bacterium]|nr:hypothetical protein [Pseudomonadota bacterium]